MPGVSRMVSDASGPNLGRYLPMPYSTFYFCAPRVSDDAIHCLHTHVARPRWFEVPQSEDWRARYRLPLFADAITVSAIPGRSIRSVTMKSTLITCGGKSIARATWTG